jgi:hypothetical protein
MSEEIDLRNVAVTVMWLVNTIKDESVSIVDQQRPLCRLNDYSEYEMYELRQAVDSEDRF